MKLQDTNGSQVRVHKSNRQVKKMVVKGSLMSAKVTHSADRHQWDF